jgi:hypothetical protein
MILSFESLRETLSNYQELTDVFGELDHLEVTLSAFVTSSAGTQFAFGALTYTLPKDPLPKRKGKEIVAITFDLFYVGEAQWLVHNQETSRKPWTITTWSQKAQGGPFGTTYYKDAKTGLWWSKDLKNDGGSAWKVHQESGGKLVWKADAAQYRNYMENKHKSPTGKEIVLKDMKMSGAGRELVVSCP